MFHAFDIAVDRVLIDVEETQEPGEALIGDTVFVDLNANGTFDEGEGLELVTVELQDTNGTTIATTETGANGFYTFGGLTGGTYVVVVDTAGRLHTHADLMEELRKIVRVVSRKREGAPHERRPRPRRARRSAKKRFGYLFPLAHWSHWCYWLIISAI